MKKLNLESLSPVELSEVYNEASKLIHNDQESFKAEYIKDNEKQWKRIGSKLKKRREALGITLKDMSGRLGCSSSKLRNFENGRPVMVAEMLEKFYTYTLDVEEANRKVTKENIMWAETLKDDELKEFYNFLWLYITETDLYDMYRYTRDDQISSYPFLDKEISSKFYTLLCDAIEEDNDLSKFEEDYEQYRREVKELRKKRLMRQVAQTSN